MLGILSYHFHKQNSPEKQERIIQREAAPARGFTQQAERAVRLDLPLSRFCLTMIAGDRDFSAQKSLKLQRKGAAKKLRPLPSSAGQYSNTSTSAFV
jgi:hypothetical protein